MAQSCDHASELWLEDRTLTEDHPEPSPVRSSHARTATLHTQCGCDRYNVDLKSPRKSRKDLNSDFLFDAQPVKRGACDLHQAQNPDVHANADANPHPTHLSTLPKTLMQVRTATLTRNVTTPEPVPRDIYHHR
jgi:hypothetical protein